MITALLIILPTSHTSSERPAGRPFAVPRKGGPGIRKGGIQKMLDRLCLFSVRQIITAKSVIP